MANNTCVITQPHQSKIPIHRQVISGRPFVAVGYPENSPNDPFARSVIESELNNRLALNDYPNQINASLCGPAVFFYCLLLSSPNVYKNIVWTLWQTGEAKTGQLYIKPSKECKHPTKFLNADCSSKISGLDWMTLASLRDSKNFGIPYKSPDDEIAGISLPGEIIEWFKYAGFTYIDTYVRTTASNFIEINQYIANGFWAVSLINPGVLKGQTIPNKPKPNHWIVWSSELKDQNNTSITNNIKDTDIVNLSVFTWGDRYFSIQPNFTFKQFQSFIFETLIFKK